MKREVIYKASVETLREGIRDGSIKELSELKNLKKEAKLMEEYMSSHTKEGDMFRRQLVVDWSNKLVDLDPSKLTFKGSFEEEAKYTLQYIDEMKFGWDYQKMREDMPFSGGFSVSEGQKVNHTKEENLEPIKVQFIINNYEFSGKIKDNNVEDSLNDELGLIQRQEKVETIKQKIIDLVNKFTW